MARRSTTQLWFAKGEKAAQSGKFASAKEAFSKLAGRLRPGSSLYWVYEDYFDRGYTLGEALRLTKRNPIPLKWTPARVRRLKGGKVQVALPVRRRK